MSILANQGVEVLVNNCAALQPGERVSIIVTPSTLEVGTKLLSQVQSISADVALVCMNEQSMHGEEPTDSVARNMQSSDVIFCLTPMSLAHTQARKTATENGARYLSLPDYSMSVLESKALNTDFQALIPDCNHLAEILDLGNEVRVVSAAGTDITFSIEGRSANRCPGVVDQPGQLGSPPDAEVNIAPLEGKGNGVIVIDGSIPCREIGVVKTPVRLEIENSTVINIHSEDKQVEQTLTHLFESAGPKSRIIGEFGIGLNPNAVLCGVMLEDEGCAGTIHFGIGSNATIGGTNDVPFHLDFIMRSPTVSVDAKVLIERGELVSDV